MAYAMRHWIASHSREDNFSSVQIAEEGLCHPSTFSRAKDLLLEKGLIVQICGFTKPNVGQGEKGLAALYRFTEAAYLLVLQAHSGRAKRTTPLALQNHSKSNSHSEHEHVRSLPACARASTQKPTEEGRGDEPSPVVKVLLAEGLERGGAEAIAKTLPSEVDTELLPFLLEVTREVVAKRGPRGGKPEPLKVHLLKCLDPELLKEAKTRQRSATSWKRSTAGVAWDSLAKPFQAHPGVSVALGRLLKAKEATKGVQPTAPGYLYAHDQVREARQGILGLILKAAGEVEVARWEASVNQCLQASAMEPGSLVWKRARTVHIQATAFKWAGLPGSLCT